jgi:hypothetical protein
VPDVGARGMQACMKYERLCEDHNGRWQTTDDNPPEVDRFPLEGSHVLTHN